MPKMSVTTIMTTTLKMIIMTMTTTVHVRGKTTTTD